MSPGSAPQAPAVKVSPAVVDFDPRVRTSKMVDSPIFLGERRLRTEKSYSYSIKWYSYSYSSLERNRVRVPPAAEYEYEKCVPGTFSVWHFLRSTSKPTVSAASAVIDRSVQCFKQQNVEQGMSKSESCAVLQHSSFLVLLFCGSDLLAAGFPPRTDFAISAAPELSVPKP
jgi:hypothetical protein